VKPVASKPPPTTTSGSGGGLNFGEIKLKKTETKETQLATKVTNVLLITKNWTSYAWLSPVCPKKFCGGS
jgi:hypothetical protein